VIDPHFADQAALEARREELRATSPIRPVVEPTDIAALARASIERLAAR